MTPRLISCSLLAAVLAAGCGGSGGDKQPKIQNPGDGKSQKMAPAAPPAVQGGQGGGKTTPGGKGI